MPADDGPVVVDTTPIIALTLVDLLDLFRSLHGRVAIPPAVRAELEAGGPAELSKVDLHSAPWIDVAHLQDPRRADLLSDLDRGEAEVIALALERRARLVVIVERLGRRHARRVGLPVTGTVGLLLRAKETRRIAEIGPILERMRQGGIFLGEDLLEEARRLAGE